MAIFHLSIKGLSRSADKPRVALAAAAYRSGETLKDQETGKTWNYKRHDDILYKAILAPEGAPEWARDRLKLWTKAEEAEKRVDARIARTITIALPQELSLEENKKLLQAFVQKTFVSKGMVADIAIHNSERNPHAHIMLTARPLEAEGFAIKKDRTWESPILVYEARKAWADLANKLLPKEKQISEKSLKAQGIDREPTTHDKRVYQVVRQIDQITKDQVKILRGEREDDAGRERARALADAERIEAEARRVAEEHRLAFEKRRRDEEERSRISKDDIDKSKSDDRGR